MKWSPQEELKIKGELSSACMLQQSMFTVVGIGVGTALAIHRKNFKPFLLSAFAGTVGDYSYGLLYACKDVLKDYNECKKAFEAAKTQEALKKTVVKKEINKKDL